MMRNSAERKLWLAVLTQHLTDACRVKPTAHMRAGDIAYSRRWLLRGEAEAVAGLVGLDADAVADGVRRLQESGWRSGVVDKIGQRRARQGQKIEHQKVNKNGEFVDFEAPKSRARARA